MGDGDVMIKIKKDGVCDLEHYIKATFMAYNMILN